MKHLMPLAPEAGASMVCVGSRLGMVGMPNQTVYSAAKGGVIALAMFSSRWETEPGPGVARVTGEEASSRARLIWWAVAPCRAATLAGSSSSSP
ncbi:hypothetical protein ACH5A2_38890 [Streptomyces collinus]|uniref:hypothetical protein n=1 Tax=Streptomyces collinus TaxID=42684 RepID=UPI0037AF1CCD